jgi:hypothetical protein
MPRCFLLLLVACLGSGCATMTVNTIPEPPATTALRVYFQPVSGLFPNGFWRIPHGEFVRTHGIFTAKLLKETGYFELVSEPEVKAAIGEAQPSRWDLESDSWALARRIGRALHADYVLIGERGAYSATEFYWSSTLVNVATGAVYGGKRSATIKAIANNKTKRAVWKRAMNEAYREIFLAAKEDLFAAAIRKKNLLSGTGEESAAPVPGAKSREQDPLGPVAPPKVSAGHHAAGAGAPGQAAAAEEAEQAADEHGSPPPEQAATGLLGEKGEASVRGKVRLVVYDLEAGERLRPAAMILSEALREELFKLGRFQLVNRENLGKVLQEIELGMSGLVDEKQAVQIGKGLAAGEVVTGQLGALGKSYILQAKRIDAESFRTLSIQSLKSSRGEEDILLIGIPDLARRLGLTGEP